MRLSTGRFGMRLVDSMHRFDSTTRPGGMREAIKSPAPLVGAEQGVLDRLPEAEAKAKSPNLKAIICLRHPLIVKMQIYRPAG